jgi:hypothetical protein
VRFLYRLLFTRDDDLDLLQIIFLGWVVFVSVCVFKVGSKQWELPTAAWSIIGSVFATLAIVGVPQWLAKILAKEPAGTPATGKTFQSFEEADAPYYGVDEPTGGA